MRRYKYVTISKVQLIQLFINKEGIYVYGIKYNSILIVYFVDNNPILKLNRYTVYTTVEY